MVLLFENITILAPITQNFLVLISNVVNISGVLEDMAYKSPLCTPELCVQRHPLVA